MASPRSKHPTVRTDMYKPRIPGLPQPTSIPIDPQTPSAPGLMGVRPGMIPPPKAVRPAPQPSSPTSPLQRRRASVGRVKK